MSARPGRPRKIATRWTQTIESDDQRKKFIEALRHDTLVLGRLKEILNEDLALLERKESRMDSYDSPSWAYRQAHLNGIRQTLLNIRDLLSFLPD